MKACRYQQSSMSWWHGIDGSNKLIRGIYLNRRMQLRGNCAETDKHRPNSNRAPTNRWYRSHEWGTTKPAGAPMVGASQLLIGDILFYHSNAYYSISSDFPGITCSNNFIPPPSYHTGYIRPFYVPISRPHMTTQAEDEWGMDGFVQNASEWE